MKGVFYLIKLLYLSFSKQLKMPRLFLFFLFELFFNSVTAQWNVNAISDTLLRNSKAVVRRYATDIKVFEEDRIGIAENLVITFLDDDALSHFRFCSIVNDSLIPKSMESKVFDLDGKRIKQANASILKDSISITRLRLISPIKLSFPLTVELEYKNTLNSIRTIRSWKPTADFGVSVENASLRLTLSDTSLISYTCNRMPLLVKNVNEDGLYVFLWEINHFLSIKKGSSLELPLGDFPIITIMSKRKKSCLETI